MEAKKNVVDILKERINLTEAAERAESQRGAALSTLAVGVVKTALENDGWDPHAIHLVAGRVLFGRNKTTVRVKMTPAGYKWAQKSLTYYHPEIVVHFTHNHGCHSDGHVFPDSLTRMIERLTNPSYWKEHPSHLINPI